MKSRFFALSRTLPLTFVAALSSAPAFASAPIIVSSAPLSGTMITVDKSATAIADDIAFAKGLASDWGFVDLASEVIKRIEKEGVDAETAVRLGVVKCQIFAEGAVAERDKDRRNELFEQTIAAYNDFLTKNPNSPAAGEARSGFISMSTAFAQSLQISMEDAIGEKAEALRTRRQEILLGANDQTGGLIDELSSKFEEEPSESVKRELVKVMISRAGLNLEIGKSSDSGSFSFEEARKILENVVFLAGEGTPDSLRAYDLIGQVYSAEQDWGQAIIYLEAVVSAALPADAKQWKQMVDELELSQSDKEQRWLFLELSIGGLIQAKLNNGDVQGATRYALHLYNTQRREGFEFSTRMGYPSLLSAARVLLDAGGVIGGKLNQGEGAWYPDGEAAGKAGHGRRNRINTTDLALRIAQQVASENQGNVLRLKAQKLLADITSLPGVIVDPNVLYEAAEGKYNEKDNEGALVAFKVVLKALEGQSQSLRIELGAKTFLRMGRTYGRMELDFEAAMAFREGCTTYLGDAEYDALNAKGYYRTIETLLKRSSGDPALQAMFQEAEDISTRTTSQDQDEILFTQGDRARKKKDYDTAIAKYSQVQRSAVDYEKALVYIQTCKHRQGERDTVLAALTDYIDNYVTNDLNGVQGTKIAKRQDALGVARFFRCLVEFEQKKYAAVIASSASFHQDHPEQNGFGPVIMNYVGNSYLQTGNLEQAKSVLSVMRADYGTSNSTSKLGTSIYKTLGTDRKKLTAGSEADLVLANEMAFLMEATNKNASKANFDNMRRESRHWKELSNWDKSVPLLEKMIAKFGALDKYQDSLAKYVRPDLGQALMMQLKVSEANVILSELVLGEGAKPSKSTLINFIKSTTGWVQGNASKMEEVPGAGQTAEAFKAATDKLNSLANSVDEKWAADWYNYKFQLAYGYYRWATAEGGPKDSKKRATAKKQLNALVQQLGSDFKGKDGVPGVHDATKDHPEFGKDVLRRRLVWLWGKVK